jgi:LysR family nitrogen assimilation transcriptional regulator
MSDLNWNAVYGFWLVARHGSFTAAARALPRGSVQALHKRIRRLESPENLALRLLKSRGVKGVELTEAGRRLYEHADGMFQSFQTLVEELRGEEGGPLAVGVTSFVSASFLPAILNSYYPAFPQVALRVVVRDSSIDVFRLVEERQVDFAICSPPQVSKRLHASVSVPLRVELISRQGEWHARDDLSWERIVSEPLVLLDRSNLVREAFEAILYRKGILSRLRIGAEVSNPELALEAVKAGYGSAIIPVGPKLLSGVPGIDRRPLPAGLTQFRICILHSSFGYLPRYAREFLKACERALSDGLGVPVAKALVAGTRARA